MSNLIQIINHPNHIVEIRLNRPEKRNAMSFALLRELLKIGEELQEQREVRAVILTGEGTSFSAGIGRSARSAIRWPISVCCPSIGRTQATLP